MARFTAIYADLPPDVQQSVVEKQLIPLLDKVKTRRSKKIIANAQRLRKRHAKIPTLDLRAKRLEITEMLHQLDRNAKLSFVKGNSNMSEMLYETVSSLSNWLNDIWNVVYEHNVNFGFAHSCLLFIATTLNHVDSGRVSCKHAPTNMYVSVTLKRKTGKRVKAFEITGVRNVEQVLFFIWRDLFLSLLATGTQRQISKISEMMEDIQDLLGWRSLERTLYGGKQRPHEHDLDNPDDPDWDTDLDSDSDCATEVSFFPEDIDSGPLYAKHWPSRIRRQTQELRRRIQSAMLVAFKSSPSHELFYALIAMSPDPASTTTELLGHLRRIAPTSSETFTVALGIYALRDDVPAIIDLLDSHGYLLRPRDATALQHAVVALARAPAYEKRAAQIVEAELLDTMHALHRVVLKAFSHLEDRPNQLEMQQILQMRFNAPGRRTRIEDWVDRILTIDEDMPHPIGFAAMMPWLPLVPGMDPGDADPLEYLDIDPTDPDLDDLREEFRPQIKARFDDWVGTATHVRGGVFILQRVCKEIILLMPWIRVTDIVEEMVTSIVGRPSMYYICEAMEAVCQFSKAQIKKARVLEKTFKARRGSTVASTSANTLPPEANAFLDMLTARPAALDEVD
ncbi:hypothetical protein WOLCODRAFT_143740 [Wolfiporia cocos MD-104 SS10]|uniref:Uncharacterized protein n=1 Tax=Wolfiporia cocos (strain MD-104) TaxID=742152 RepID=A0A2H3JYC7_WOLCO|nr:hypothetical protein WOLCODRAFT_143740 [Wolfiporia cocos MD-104 SS10]